jgi:hypothetical protein
MRQAFLSTTADGIAESRPAAHTSASLLSPQERRKREDAVRFATASIGLEGFTMSVEAQARAQRYISGEIDLAEFVQGR